MTTHPSYTALEGASRETFLALMWALSYPGRLYHLPASNDIFALIADALLDLETSYYSPDPQVATMLARTGAKALLAEEAAYHFYPSLNLAALESARRASVGTMLFPDSAATLFIGCVLESGPQITVSGPGINGQQAFLIDAIPTEFWSLRDSICHYPLGWDVFFVSGQQVIGLPRSAKVTR